MGPSMIVDGDAKEQQAAADRELASMGPSMIVDGDGQGAQLRAPRVVASMGPSMIVGGDSRSYSGSRPPERSFNGAVDDRRRRRSCRVVSARREDASMGP